MHCFCFADSLLDYEPEFSRRKGYQCNICLRFYKKKSYLETHLQIHSGVKKYACEICLQEFVVENYYKRHMENHRLNRISNTTCSVCKQTFSSKDLLLQHIKKHGSIYMKIVFMKLNKTEQCQNDANSEKRSDVQRKEFDEGESEDECVSEISEGACDDVDYGDSDICKSDDEVSSNNKSPEVKGEICHEESSKVVEDKTRRLLCKICGRYFNTGADLISHRKFHRKRVVFKCKKCPKVFFSEKNCKFHMRVHKTETEDKMWGL